MIFGTKALYIFMVDDGTRVILKKVKGVYFVVRAPQRKGKEKRKFDPKIDQFSYGRLSNALEKFYSFVNHCIEKDYAESKLVGD